MKEVINYMAAQLAKVAMVTGLMAGVMVPALAANAASQYCSMGPVHRVISVNGNTATGEFDLPKHCGHGSYSLVVYTSGNKNLMPFSNQKVYSFKTKGLNPGRHTISASVPSCGFYQVDLVKGSKILYNLSNSNLYGPAGRLITATSGGHKCAPTPAPATPAAPAPQAPATVNNTSVNTAVNIDNSVHDSNNTNINQQQQQGGSGTQTQNIDTSNGTHVGQTQTMDNNTQTQTTETPAAPAADTTQTQDFTGKGELVNTGPGSVAATFAGVSAVSALAYNMVLRRKRDLSA